MSKTPQDLLQVPKGKTRETAPAAVPGAPPRPAQYPLADKPQRRFPLESTDRSPDHWPRVFPGI
jgi:hypothetical protein